MKIVAMAGGMDKHSVEATMALLRYYTGKSIAYLGHTEFQDLASTADWDALGKLGEVTDRVSCRIVRHLIAFANAMALSKANTESFRPVPQ